MSNRLWHACLLSLLLLSAAPAHADQAALDRFADRLGYRFTVISNKITEGCPGNPTPPTCYSAALDLTLPTAMPSGEPVGVGEIVAVNVTD